MDYQLSYGHLIKITPAPGPLAVHTGLPCWIGGLLPTGVLVSVFKKKAPFPILAFSRIAESFDAGDHAFAGSPRRTLDHLGIEPVVNDLFSTFNLWAILGTK